MDPRNTFLLLLFFLGLTWSDHVDSQKARDWHKEGQDELSEALRVRPMLKEAKNVILFIGDGMGVTTVTSSRIHNAQKSNRNYWDGRLSFDEFPHVGLTMTYCTDQMTTDSTASATAFLTGTKTKTGLIGLKDHVKRGGCDQQEENKLTSVLKYAHQAGKRTGVVSTTRITHGTPASAYANTAERAWESETDLPEGSECKDIARQLIEDNNYINVLLGGGRSQMTSNTTSDPEYPKVMGRRKDGRNLIEEWKRTMKQTFTADDEKYKFVQRLEEFNEVDPEKVERLLGLFEPSNMHYEVDRLNMSKNVWPEPSLAEMTEKAISILEKEDKGYFLFVESGLIDYAHHVNNAFRALNETVALSEAVRRAVEMTDDKDTLILVTADHSHTLSIAGHPSLDSNVLGLSTNYYGDLVENPPYSDALPYTILGYANGPSYFYHYNSTSGMRRNLTNDDVGTADSVYPATVPLYYETHAAEDVALYARGPLSHLVTGTHEISYIAHLIMYASCIGPQGSRNFCKENPDYKDWPRDPKFVDPATVKSGVKLFDCGTMPIWIVFWLTINLFV